MSAYSEGGYRRLLRLALDKGYAFVGFADTRWADGRYIVLRHDIDFSFRPALELAAINRSLGIRGTFCVLLRSGCYNLLSAACLEAARRIQEMGQHLALHYIAPATVPASDAELAASIRADFEIARQHLPEIEPVFSWHNPSPELLRRGLRLDVPGLVNAYGEAFVEKILYLSDSNMRHSAAELERIIAQDGHLALQLLVHPDNWIPGGASMTEVLGQIWKNTIRGLEQEMGSNRVYREMFPDGMPEHVVQEFVESWRRSTRPS